VIAVVAGALCGTRFEWFGGLFGGGFLLRRRSRASRLAQIFFGRLFRAL